MSDHLDRINHAFPSNINESYDSDGDCGTSGLDFDPLDQTAGTTCGDNADQCDSGSSSYGLVDIDGDGRCSLLAGDTYNLDLGADFRDGEAQGDPDGTILSACDVINTEPEVDAIYGAACAGDDDGDGVENTLDLFPFNGAESADFDGDCEGIVSDYDAVDAGNGCGDNSDSGVTFTGTLTSLYSASGFSDGGAYVVPEAPALANLTYDLDITIDQATGNYSSATIRLNGTFSTVGVASIPGFAQQTFTFTDAVYNLTIADDVAISINTAKDSLGTYQPTGSGSIVINGGAADPATDVVGSTPTQPIPTLAPSLVSGTAVCTGGSCASLTPELISFADISYTITGGNLDSTVNVEFLSNTNGTAYLVFE